MRAFLITAAFPHMAELPRESGFAMSAAHSEFNGDGGLPGAMRSVTASLTARLRAHKKMHASDTRQSCQTETFERGVSLSRYN
ncbi:hypothetical protein [Paraburkholderia tuberum]|uniref:hypothetical protein n=1 Tax=Paraburkholderia TaxID=1822464 RepID=UPI00035FC353|nr:hypothetical protein [Paraburkholderia tuberum]